MSGAGASVGCASMYTVCGIGVAHADATAITITVVMINAAVVRIWFDILALLAK